MKVKLDYFKPNGKWYSDGEFESSILALWEIWEQVREMQIERELPGLRQDHGSYIVSIDIPEHEHNHPHLLIPPNEEILKNEQDTLEAHPRDNFIIGGYVIENLARFDNVIERDNLVSKLSPHVRSIKHFDEILNVLVNYGYIKEERSDTRTMYKLTDKAKITFF